MKQRVILALALWMLVGCERDTDYLITIHTEFGDMKAVLYDETPEHKENFLDLAEKGLYDSTLFYRIIREFMIQGGDVNRKPGFQDSIDYTIPAEFVPKFFHKKGALAAARRSDNINPERESSGSQFYIVHGRKWTERELLTDMNKLNTQVGVLVRIPKYDSIGKVLLQLYQEQRFDEYNSLMLDLIPEVEERLGQDVSRTMPKERIEVYKTIGGAPWLDDQYTVFGQVVEGLEVVDKIANLRTTAGDMPLAPVVMRVTLEELPKKEITELYGIEYPETEEEK